MALILDHINGVADGQPAREPADRLPELRGDARHRTAAGTSRDIDVEIECARCGKRFARVGREQRYCSRACGTRYRARSAGRRLASRKVERPPYEQLVREIAETSYVAVGPEVRRVGQRDPEVDPGLRARAGRGAVAAGGVSRETARDGGGRPASDDPGAARAGDGRGGGVLPGAVRVRGAPSRRRVRGARARRRGAAPVGGERRGVARARGPAGAAGLLGRGVVHRRDRERADRARATWTRCSPSSRRRTCCTRPRAAAWRRPDFGTREFATLDLDGNLLSFFRWETGAVGGRAPRAPGSRLADRARCGTAGGSSCLNGHLAVEYPLASASEREYIARSMRARLIALTVAALLLPASSAAAGDPIMPLSQVRSGMQCTGYSVVRGTEISSFDVEILEVIDGDASGQGPRLLVRVSGPAVDGTGRRAGLLRLADLLPRRPGHRPQRRRDLGVARRVRRRRRARDADRGDPRHAGRRPGRPRRAPRPRAARARSSGAATARSWPAPSRSPRRSRSPASAPRWAARSSAPAAAPAARCSPRPRARSAPTRRSRCARAPRSASPTRWATSRSGRSARSPTPTRTACGRSATRSRTPASAACSCRTPTSTA